MSGVESAPEPFDRIAARPTRDYAVRVPGKQVQTARIRLGSGLALCLVLGALLRFEDLDHRPMHCDEAVHAWKLYELWSSGTYRYDPHEYHGPTLYYLTLPVLWFERPKQFADFTETQLRIVPALFGLAMIPLLLCLRDAIGQNGVVGAAVLTAVSTAMVFYSRYYIQETLLVFFTFLLIAAAWRFFRSRRPAWAVIAGAAAGLMHATKETCVIALGCAAAAGLIWRVWSRADLAAEVHDEEPRQLSPAPGSPTTRRPRSSISFITGTGVALLTAAAVSIAFYSSLFTHAHGPIDSLRTFVTYFDRAGGHGLHDHPWDYYLRILTFVRWAPGPWWSEASILLLAIIGGARAFTTGDNDRLRRLLLRWLLPYTVLMFTVYSAIPYKTPWCILGALHGAVLLAGVGVATMIQWARRWPVRLGVGLLLVFVALHLARQTTRSIRRFCCDNRNPYVYAHTVRDIHRLGEFVHKLAAVHPDPDRMLIRVITPDYWPLPWTLRSLPHVGYWDSPPEDCEADIIITDSRMEEVVAPRLSGDYFKAYYGLRPDVTLAVLVEPALWSRLLQSAGIRP